MASNEESDFKASQLATVTLDQIALDRERLRRLWVGLNETESVIRRGQLAYLESTGLLRRGNGSAAK
jgi:hypothetical protein